MEVVVEFCVGVLVATLVVVAVVRFSAPRTPPLPPLEFSSVPVFPKLDTFTEDKACDWADSVRIATSYLLKHDRAMLFSRTIIEKFRADVVTALAQPTSSPWSKEYYCAEIGGSRFVDIPLAYYASLFNRANADTKLTLLWARLHVTFCLTVATPAKPKTE